jgi:hypothetical protein
MRTPPFFFSLLISISIHGLFLWYWSLLSIRHTPRESLVETRLISSAAPLESGKGSAPESKARAKSGAAPRPSRQIRNDQTPRSSAGVEGSTPGTGRTPFQDEGAVSPDVEDPVGDGRISGGLGAGSGTARSGTGGDGKAAPGTRVSEGRGKGSSDKTAPATASTPIPEPPQHLYRYRFSGSYHVQVDHYVLNGMNIPGTELCLAGDQLRTRGEIIITQLETDRSKCRIRTRGDEENEICPPESKREVIAFQGVLSSPVNYHVNKCLEYDSSNCRIIRAGTDREREFCKIDFKYEGVWEAGTKFEHKCTKSEIVTHSHPLVYNIRYMIEIGTNDDDRIRSREVYRIKQSIPQC